MKENVWFQDESKGVQIGWKQNGWILDKNKGVDIGCVDPFEVMQKKSFNLLGFNRKGSLFHINIICNTFRATICKHSMCAMGSKF